MYTPGWWESQMACPYFGGQLLIFIKITITSQVEYRMVTEWNTISTEKAQSGLTVLTQKDTQSRESKKECTASA